MTREKLPNKRRSIAFTFEFEGHRYRASATRFADGRLAELFLDAGKFNSPLQQQAETAAVLVSLLLQHGVSVDVILHSIRGPIATALLMAEAP
ncbi:hypothetical protein [Bradyrhizobium sp. BRP56]|uniref:hypothetical protein n=1 Tax=Bradyrhizobium sp. BRP56 TaxID=2793819 RepID=UPI001CD67F82|nr:hypothetical protein [Bradyrhizobium sp. BRP56]MCA1399348.1 hypothetical protein [Bradyrhizobium sp. BRP56]